MTTPTPLTVGQRRMIPSMALFHFSDLRKMEQACQGIWAISRIVGNGANDSERAGNQQLDPWVVANLLGGIESLCDHITDLVESALDEFRFTDEAKPIH